MKLHEQSLNSARREVRFFELIPGILRLILRLWTVLREVRAMLIESKTGKASIGQYQEKAAVRFADKMAILFEDRSYTYAEYNRMVNRFAHFFLSLGIKKGDALLVFLESRPETLFCISAAAKIGAIASLVNSNLRNEALRHCITITSPKIFLVGEELVDAFEEVRADLNIADNHSLFFLKDRGIKAKPHDYQDFDALVREAPTFNPATVAEVTVNDIFAYIFTSGTTGLPKASFQPHRAWTGAWHWVARVNMNLNPGDILYVPLPFFHSNAVNLAWPSAFAGGATIVMRRKFSTNRFWDEINRYEATAFAYIGELCSYLMNQPESDRDSDNPVRKIIGNGFRPEIWKPFKKRFAIPKICEMYGSSESSLLLSNLFNIDETIGFTPLPHAVVKYDMESGELLRDNNGFLCKAGRGETGLLLGNCTKRKMFHGYTDKKGTEKKYIRDAFQKGDAWYNSGDLVRNIGFKHYQFVDRLGDTFRWKGENVSTKEVEKAVNSFHQVSESSVYGVTIPGSDGRIGMATIIPDCKMQVFDLMGFASDLQQSLPSYAIPKFIRFKKEFETTATFKIKKINLQKEGFDISVIDDPLFVLLPGRKEFQELDERLYAEIAGHSYQF